MASVRIQFNERAIHQLALSIYLHVSYQGEKSINKGCLLGYNFTPGAQVVGVDRSYLSMIRSYEIHHSTQIL